MRRGESGCQQSPLNSLQAWQQYTQFSGSCKPPSERLKVIYGQFRSRILFADSAIATAEPKTPTQHFSLFLAHWLPIRL